MRGAPSLNLRHPSPSSGSFGRQDSFSSPPLRRPFRTLLLAAAALWPSAEGHAQATAPAPAGSPAADLRRYFVPDSLPAEFVFDLDSGRATQFWRVHRQGNYLITEQFDERYRMQEYRRVRLDERGAFLDSYATYLRDSAGSGVPLFVELGSPDLFYWSWPIEDAALLSYREPRRMDARMAGIRVDRERHLLPDLDTLDWRGHRVPLRFTSDFVRLAFYDRKGNAIGEDRYLEFATWGEGLGLLGYVRRFGDGGSVSGHRLPARDGD